MEKKKNKQNVCLVKRTESMRRAEEMAVKAAAAAASNIEQETAKIAAS